MLALNKIEIVVLTKKWIPITFFLRVGDATVEAKPVVKYLGVVIDNKMSFFEQIRRAADKVSKGVTALSILMSNVEGCFLITHIVKQKCSKRSLLMTTIQSVLLYGVKLWADALDKKINRKRLFQVQKRAAAKCSSVYRSAFESVV